MKLSVSFQLLDLDSQQDPLDGWSARHKASANCPGWLCWWWRSWWNERFCQGKPKYSEKICPDVTLSSTNPTCQTRARTRAAVVRSQRLTASAMARPLDYIKKQRYPRRTSTAHISRHEYTFLLKDSVALVPKQTIPTERPPLVGEVSANFLRIEGVAWSAQRISRPLISIF
jgi:hypothetical protein